MISNILNGKLMSPCQKKKLVSLENCYMHLKPYFKVRKGAKTNEANKVLAREISKNVKVQSTFNSIEQNQILYAKLMTERLLKV